MVILDPASRRWLGSGFEAEREREAETEGEGEAWCFGGGLTVGGQGGDGEVVGWAVVAGRDREGENKEGGRVVAGRGIGGTQAVVVEDGSDG